MSTSIDERVVEMRFDNRQFENNIKDSITSLDELKKSLDLNTAATKLNNFISIFSTAFHGIKSVTENVSGHIKHFANEIGQLTGISQLFSSEVSKMKQTFAALTGGAIQSGFQEYELKINSTRTILSNVEKNYNSTEEAIDAVTDSLERLNKYADQTIYNFGEMTRNIGYFTVAGVDLETSVAAIKGFSNMAALSGADSQRAANATYQLSQALSTGYIRLLDWRQAFSFPNIGGQALKDTVIDIAKRRGVNYDDILAGKIDGSGKVKKTQKAYRSFEETLQEGWLTTDIMMEALKVYSGDYGEEFTNFLEDTAKTSGYFQKALNGDSETLKKYGLEWKDLQNLDQEEKVAKIAKAIGDLDIELRHDETVDYLMQSLGYTKEAAEEAYQTGVKANRAAKEVTTFTKLVDALKEASQSGWSQSWEIIIGGVEGAKKVWTKVNDEIGGMLSRSAEKRNQMLKEWKESDDMLVDDGSGEKVHKLFLSIANFYQGIKGIGGHVKSIFSEMFGTLDSNLLISGTNKIYELSKSFKDFVTGTGEAGSGLDRLTPFITSIGSAIRFVWDIISGFRHALLDIAKKILFSEEFSSGLTSIGEGISNIISKLRGAGIIEKIGTVLSAVVMPAIRVVGAGIRFILNIFTALGQKLKDIGITDRIKNLFGKLGSWVSDAIDKVGTWAQAIIDWLADSTVISTAVDWLSTAVTWLASRISKAFGFIRDIFMKAWNWIKNINFKDLFSNIWNGIKGFFKNFGNNIRLVGSSILDFISNTAKKIWGGIKKVFGWIGRAFNNVTSSVKDFFKRVFGGVKKGATGAVKGLAEGAETINDGVQGFLKKVLASLNSLVDLVLPTIRKITTTYLLFNTARFLGGFATFGRGIGKAGKEIANGLKEFRKSGGLTSLADTIANPTFTKTEIIRRVDSWPTAVLKITTSLALVVAAIKVLSDMKPEQFKTAVIRLGMIAAVFVAFVGLTSLFGSISKISGGNGISNIGKTLLSISGAMAIAAVAMKLFYRLDAQEFVVGGQRAGIVFAALTVSVAIIARASGTANRNSKRLQRATVPLLRMCLALLAMYEIIKLYNKIGGINDPDGWKTFGNGFGKIAIVIASLTASMSIIGRNSRAKKATVSMLGICAALFAMYHVIKLFSGMNWTDFGNGFGQIAIVLATLTAVASVIGRNGKSGVSLRKAFKRLLIVGVLLGAILGAIYGIGAFVNKFPKANQIFKDGTEILKTVGRLFATFFESLLGVFGKHGIADTTIALAAIGVFSYLIGKMGVGTALKLSLNLTIFTASLLLILSALGALASIDGFDTLIDKGIGVLTKIGEGIGRLTGEIAGSFLDQTLKGLGDIGTYLSDFGTNATPFINNFMPLLNDIPAGSFNKLATFAEAISSFTGTMGSLEISAGMGGGKLKGLKGGYGEGDYKYVAQKYTEYADGLSTIIDAVGGFITKMADFDSEKSGNVDKAIELFGKVRDVVADLEAPVSEIIEGAGGAGVGKTKIGTGAAAIGGYLDTAYQNFDVYGEGIAKMVGAISGFIASIDAVEGVADSTTVESYIDKAKELIGAFSQLTPPEAARKELNGGAGLGSLANGLARGLGGGGNFLDATYQNFAQYARGLSTVSGAVKDLILAVDEIDTPDTISQVVTDASLIIAELGKLTPPEAARKELNGGAGLAINKFVSGLGGGGNFLDTTYQNFTAYADGLSKVTGAVQSLILAVDTISSPSTITTVVGEAESLIDALSKLTPPVKAQKELNGGAGLGSILGGSLARGLGGGGTFLDNTYQSFKEYADGLSKITSTISRFITAVDDISDPSTISQAITDANSLIDTLRILTPPAEARKELNGGGGVGSLAGIFSGLGAGGNFLDNTYQSFKEYADGLAEITGAVSNFITSVDSMDSPEAISTAITKATEIIGALSMLTAPKQGETDANAWGGAFLGFGVGAGVASTDYVNTVYQSFEQYSKGIVRILSSVKNLVDTGKSLLNQGYSIGDVQTVLGSLTDLVSGIIGSISGMQAPLSSYSDTDTVNGGVGAFGVAIVGSYYDTLTQAYQNFEEYSAGIVAIIGGINDLLNTILSNEITYGGTSYTAIEKIFGFIGGFFESLGGLSAPLSYMKSAEGNWFSSSEAVSYYGSFASIAESVSSLLSTVVELFEFISGLSSSVTGESPTTVVASLGDLLTSISGFIEHVSSVQIKDIPSGADLDNLTLFFTGLRDSLVDISTSMHGVGITTDDLLMTSNLLSVLDSIIALGSDGNIYAKFTEMTRKLSNSLTSTNATNTAWVARLSANMRAFGEAMGSNVVGPLVEGLKTGMSTSEDFSLDSLWDVFPEQSDSLASAIETACTIALSSVSDSIKSKFFTAGMNFAAGLANGIRAGTSLVTAASSAIGAASTVSLNAAIRSASPSRATMESGQYFSEGYAIGITKNVGEAIDAAQQLGNATIDQFAGLPDIMSAMFAGALNSDETAVSPVLDMSALSFNADSFNRSARTFDMAMSRGLANDAMVYHQSGQNGDIVNAINSMSTKLDNFNNELSNMKIVLDSGIMAGHLAKGIDRHIGGMIDSTKRRNAV